MASDNQFSLQTSGMQASIAFDMGLESGVKIRSTPYGDKRPKRKCYTCFDMDLRTGMPDFDEDGIVVHYIDFFEALKTNSMKLRTRNLCLSCGFLSTCVMSVVQSFQTHFTKDRAKKVAYIMLESRVPGGPMYVAWNIDHPMNANWDQIAIRLELYTLPGS